MVLATLGDARVDCRRALPKPGARTVEAHPRRQRRSSRFRLHDHRQLPGGREQPPSRATLFV